jgi:hypothetical protein
MQKKKRGGDWQRDGVPTNKNMNDGLRSNSTRTVVVWVDDILPRTTRQRTVASGWPL